MRSQDQIETDVRRVLNAMPEIQGNKGTGRGEGGEKEGRGREEEGEEGR